MPTKNKVNTQSKKVIGKKIDKMIEDKTFGLKNKNKSKKVQQHIQSVKKNVQNSSNSKSNKMDEHRRQAKNDANARRKAEQERNILFGDALLAVQKKTTTKTKGVNEAKGRDHDDEKGKNNTSRAMKMMYQMDANEMEAALTKDTNYLRTLEDDVEQLRQMKLIELKEGRMKGTPVTLETFKIWKEKKRKEKIDVTRKIVETEIDKKGGKGLSVLTGRDLFEYKRDLFKDEDCIQGLGNTMHECVYVDEPTKSILDFNTDLAKVESDLFLEGDDWDDLRHLDFLVNDSREVG